MSLSELQDLAINDTGSVVKDKFNGNMSILESEISSVASQLSGKANAIHNHTGYADVNHDHSSSYPAINHTHSVADITGLETQLSGKADSAHEHVLSDITDIETLLGTVGAANVHLSGASANSHHLLLTASHTGDASVVEYNFIYSFDDGIFASIKTASPTLLLPKNFNEDSIYFTYRVIITNIFDREQTAGTENNTVTVHKYTGGITVSEIVDAIITRQAFMNTIIDGVAQKTVVEVWAKQQSEETEE